MSDCGTEAGAIAGHDKTRRRDGERMDALTGIRAIASLWVVGYHFSLLTFAALELQRFVPAIQFGYIGVDLFFLLSGFIIMHVHGRDTATLAMGPLRRFYGLRLARIYPVHLLMLLVVLLIVAGGALVGI